MGFIARAYFKYPWGRLDPGAKSFSFAGRAAFRRALARPGAVKNLATLGSAFRGNAFTYTSDDSDTAFGVCLAWRQVFQDTDNESAAWTAISGSDYLQELPSPFQDGTVGLKYARTSSGDSGVFQSTGLLVGRNKPFALRVRFYKPPEGQEWPVVTFRVPGGTPHLGWQMQIARGRASVMCLKAGHTQTQEEALHALLANPTIDEAAQEAIDESKAALYRDEVQLDVRGDLYTQTHTFVFIPEPRGVVTVFDGQGEVVGQYKDTQILASRKDGALWGDAPLWVRSNGPAFDWQFGRLQFAPTGQLRLGRYPTFTSGAWEFSHLRSVQAGVTSVAMVNEELNEAFDEVVVNFATEDAEYTPFFYAGYAVRWNAVRTGYNSAVALDTYDLPSSPFEEIEPVYEPLHRRSMWNCRLRNVEGATAQGLVDALSAVSNQLRFHSPAFEHMQVDLWLGDTTGLTRVLCNGIVRASGHAGMSQATENDVDLNLAYQNFGGASKVMPVLCDQWAILDETLLEKILPVGDGKRLGAYLRDCLRLIGLHNNEMTGVSALVGRVLPQARPGEPWLVQPAKGASLGDWIRHLLDAYGNGRQLWVDTNGVWQFAFRSVASRHSFEVGSLEDRVFVPLDAWRELSPNYFRAEGAEGPDGQPLVATWTLNRGIFQTASAATPGSRNYVGRVIPYPTLRDPALVTQSDVDFAVRSLAMQHAKPGRGFNGSTFMRNFTVFPGDYITVHGLFLEVERIGGGSIAFGSPSSEETEDGLKGKLQWTLREWEPLIYAAQP